MAAVLSSFIAFLLLCTTAVATVTPFNSSASDGPFKLIAANETSTSNLESLLHSGHGIQLVQLNSIFYLGLSKNPSQFKRPGLNPLDTTYKGQVIITQNNNIGPITLKVTGTHPTAFEWVGNLLRPAVDGVEPGDFRVCRAPNSTRSVVYWNAANENGAKCSSWNVTYLQAVTVDST